MQLDLCNGSALGSVQSRGSLASHHLKSRGACDGPGESLDGGISLLGLVLQTAVLSGVEMCGKADSNRVELVLDHPPPVIIVKAIDHETVRESALTDDVHRSISGWETGRKRRGDGNRVVKERGQAGKFRGARHPGAMRSYFGSRETGCGSLTTSRQSGTGSQARLWWWY